MSMLGGGTVDASSIYQFFFNENFRGYATNFKEKATAVIKNNIVLVLINDRWQKIGYFIKYSKPIKIRANREYECIGEIRSNEVIYHVVKTEKGYMAF